MGNRFISLLERVKKWNANLGSLGFRDLKRRVSNRLRSISVSIARKAPTFERWQAILGRNLVAAPICLDCGERTSFKTFSIMCCNTRSGMPWSKEVLDQTRDGRVPEKARPPRRFPSCRQRQTRGAGRSGSACDGRRVKHPPRGHTMVTAPRRCALPDV